MFPNDTRQERVSRLVAVFQFEGAHLFQAFLRFSHDAANIGFLLVAQTLTIFAEDGCHFHFDFGLGGGGELGHGNFRLGLKRLRLERLATCLNSLGQRVDRQPVSLLESAQ